MEYTNQKIQIVTTKGAEIFENLTEAKKIYPTLDPNKNTRDFTWGMANGEYMRFEDWETERIMSA